MRTSLALLGVALTVAACSAAQSDGDASDSALIDSNRPAMTKARLDAIVAGGAMTLDAVPALLPSDFRINAVLKHGKVRTGEHGHLTETDVSQSADPDAPRAIVWDERSGFVLSWNGGTAGQTEGQRIDVMEFDDAKKEFRLSGLVFANGASHYESDPTIAEPNRKCAHCHGTPFRPIFAMYPDWPSFYGSENDELTDASKDVQRAELADFTSFRKTTDAQKTPRYAPLFDRAAVKSELRGIDLYATFPYRQNVDTEIHAVSRAFAFRPSLRFGVLMNRLTAQAVAKRIIDHPNFDAFGAMFLHGLLECRYPGLATSAWPAKVAAENGAAPRLVANGTTFHYRDLLKIFDLEVKDVDIRYSYGHAGFASDDANDKPMETGYVDGEYWNSYFDGSATIDELVSMQVLQALASRADLHGLSAAVTAPNGLDGKYSHLTDRYAFDKAFFQEMDRKGMWIPIPYPRSLQEVHHREGYPASYTAQHDAICGVLRTKLAGTTALSEPATACPSSCVASTFCKDNPNASSAIHVGDLPCVTAGAGGCQPCR